MISEIFIEGRRLDADATNSLLNFALDDIRDFSSRQTTWSKTIVLPGTANNNAIFGNIFDTGISNDYDPAVSNIGYNFNAAKSATCIIFQDNMQTFKGTVRMLEIDAYQGQIEYQVALNGELTSLSVSLISKLLTDLDFSAYDKAYTVANISGSWSNTPGSGVMFPMIDYGTYSALKHDWQFGTFRPALYVREYIDKMFTQAGFRYDAPLFDTDRFKRLVVPHNQKEVLSPKTGQLFVANHTGEVLITQVSGPREDDVVFGTFTGGLFSTTDNKTFTFNGATALSGTMTILLSGHYNYGLNVFFDTEISLNVNGSQYLPLILNLNDHSSGDHSYAKGVHLNLTLNPGDTISVHYKMISPGFTLANGRVWIDTGAMGFVTTTTVNAPVEYGETIQMNYNLPQNIRQVDFLVSIVKMWNLYIYEDTKDERLIHIRPFIDFYDQGEGSVVDWSDKMDRMQVVKVKPMSELNTKIYNFNFADDSDYFNDLYKKRYNRGYGSFIFDTDFEFSSNTTKVEVIFASTPLVGYNGEEKVYPTIFKKSGTTEDKTDSVIRIMQTAKITGVTSWEILNNATILGTYTQYGYAGHYDDPDNPGNDLNFGQLSELFFQLSTAASLDHTQFNVFWSQYMAEITDKDSKLLSAKFYLTPKDIFDLRFSRFVMVDNVLYRLNKITDYNASQPDLCEVELLRIINTSYRYPIGSTVEDDYALQWNDTEAILWNDDQEMLYK